MPAKKEIVDYINNGLKDGHSVDSLRNTLINAGWPQQDVEDSIKYASGSVQNTPSKPAVNMGFFTRFKTVLFHPGSFFEAVKGEEGYSDAFKYFLILTLIPVLASSLSSTTSLGSSSQSLGFTDILGMKTDAAVPFIEIPTLFVQGYIIAIIFLLISVALTFLFVKLFRGSGGIHQTFKAIVYGSLTPNVIASIILILIAIFMLVAPGSSFLLAVISLIIASVISFIFSIWSIILQIIGISKLHDVTKLKALIIVIIFPVVLIGITMGSALFALGALSPSTWTTVRATGFHNIGAPESGLWQLSENPASDQFHMVLTNGMRSRIRINDITVSVDGEACTTTSGTGFVNIGSDITIEANCGYQIAGSSYTADIEIEYENLDTGLKGFTETGVVSGSVS